MEQRERREIRQGSLPYTRLIRAIGLRFAGSSLFVDLCFKALLCTILPAAFCQGLGAAELDDYEGRPIASVEIVFDGSPPDPAVQADLMSLLKVAPNTDYSAVRIRDSLQTLFDSGRVA